MSLLEKTKLLLRSHRSLPKKSFGQNFIIDKSIYERMISYASLDKNDTTLDIGAGLGFLSQMAAEQCRKVLAVEADRQMAIILREQLASVDNIEIIEQDIFKTTIPVFNKILSTPPYNISSKLMTWLMQRSFDCGVLVFQKEFADRLVACVGTKTYGWLAVLAQSRAEIEILNAVSKAAFYPQPKVDSVIIRLSLKKKEFRPNVNDIVFVRLIQTLFSHRNRKVRGAVSIYLRNVVKMSRPELNDVIAKLPYAERRVRDLTPEDFGVVADVVCRQKNPV